MPQFARPDADTTNTGGWINTPLFSKIDEDAGALDGTVISSDGNPTSSETFVVRLSDVTDPQSSNGHTLRASWAKNQGGGAPFQGTAELRQGYVSEVSLGTLIATLTSPNITGTTVQTDSLVLSGGQTDTITDYTDLFIRVWAAKAGGGPNRPFKVDALELEVPDAGAVVVEGDGVSAGVAAVSSDSCLVLTTDGSAAGAATVLADGVAAGPVDADGAAVGTSVVAGVGESSAVEEADAAAAGVSVVAGVGSGGIQAEADGSAAGAAAVAGLSAAIVRADGAAAAAASVSINSEVVSASTGLATGTATAGAVSSALAVGDGAATGAAAVTGDAEWVFAGVASSSGAAASDWDSETPSSPTVGTSAGSSVVAGVGETPTAAQGQTAGIAAATADSVSVSAGLADAAAASIVTGVGDSGGATGSDAAAAGVATVLAESCAVLPAVWNATGAGVVTGIGPTSGFAETHKPITGANVEAVRWFDGGSFPASLDPLKVRTIGNRVELDVKDVGWDPLRSGDWVFVDAAGDVRAIPHTLFQVLFEVL